MITITKLAVAIALVLVGSGMGLFAVTAHAQECPQPTVGAPATDGIIGPATNGGDHASPPNGIIPPHHGSPPNGISPPNDVSPPNGVSPANRLFVPVAQGAQASEDICPDADAALGSPDLGIGPASGSDHGALLWTLLGAGLGALSLGATGMAIVRRRDA